MTNSYHLLQEKKCTSHPKKSCHDVAKKIPSSHPKKVCNKKPKQKCHSVPQQVPEKVSFCRFIYTIRHNFVLF